LFLWNSQILNRHWRILKHHPLIICSNFFFFLFTVSNYLKSYYYKNKMPRAFSYSQSCRSKFRTPLVAFRQKLLKLLMELSNKSSVMYEKLIQTWVILKNTSKTPMTILEFRKRSLKSLKYTPKYSQNPPAKSLNRNIAPAHSLLYL
jgi:hypothetical protein